MAASDLKFPVLCLSKYGPEVMRTLPELTTTFQAVLDDGYFKDLEIVDSDARRYRVTSVASLGGVGPLWGYSLFYSRRVKVELSMEKLAGDASLAQLRQVVLKNFLTWHGWKSREDFAELKVSVEKAESVGEIVRALAS